MRNRLRLFGLIGVLAFVWGSIAFAAGTQTATINSTTFTDLGVAPVQVQTLTQPVTVVVADTIPTVGTAGTNLLPGQLVQFNPADASSHVWAAKLGATTVVNYSPVYATGGSAGGSVTATQGTAATAATAWWDQLSQGGTAVGATNGLYVQPGTGAAWAATQSGLWNIGGLTGIANSASRTRVANTTTYTANTTWCANTATTVCAPLQVTLAGANAATGTFGRVWLLKSGSTLTNANFTIWFFSAAPTTTAQYDNTAYVGPFAADLPNFLGSMTCNSMQATNDSSAQSFSECTPNTPSGWLQYKTLSGQPYVDALISVTAAYAPGSAEALTIYANSYQDK